MLFFISVCSAFAVFLFFMSLVALSTPEKINITRRLQDTTGGKEHVYDIRESELQRSFSERVLRPFLGKLAQHISKLLPGAIHTNLKLKLNRAGNPWGIGADEFLALKFFTPGVLLIPVFMISLSRGPDVLALTLWGGALGAGWFLPDAYLQSLIRKHIQTIEKTMPDVLDLLTVSVEAGYSWDGALQKVVQKKKGPLSAEFRRVLQEAGMGKPRREALRGLAERVNVPCVTTFVAAVVQADQLGLSLGQVLRTQSEQIRRKRRQEIEEEAMKVPIKILIPLVFFVFPAIFVILLGPALVQIMVLF